MKIAILTFHYSGNYGAVLQAYALQRVLQDMGHEVAIIGYVPAFYRFRSLLQVAYTRLKRFSASSWREIYIHIRYGGKHMRTFDSFRDGNMNVTKKIRNRLPEVANDFDAIIVGSDQIWNSSQHAREIYFLDWKPGYGGRRVAYSACCGVNRIKDKDREKLSAALMSFDSISVRDRETVDFVCELTGKCPVTAADPVLLHDFGRLKIKEDIPGEYIFAYILGDEIRGGHARAVEAIRSVYGMLPVIALSDPAGSPKRQPWAQRNIYGVPPPQWLGLLANATYVYTDSFHGILFALKYRRPFTAFHTGEVRGKRLEDAGKRYGISDRIVTAADEMTMGRVGNENLDFDHIEEVITRHKEESLMFLRNALTTI